VLHSRESCSTVTDAAGGVSFDPSFAPGALEFSVDGAQRARPLLRRLPRQILQLSLRAKYIENVRALLASTLDQLVTVCLIAPNLENVMQLLVRERMQVWPYLVVLSVAFILFQPLCNRIVGMHWCA
jgi:hypothetical protein